MKALVPNLTFDVSDSLTWPSWGLDTFVLTTLLFKMSLTDVFALFVTTVVTRFKSRFFFGLLAIPWLDIDIAGTVGEGLDKHISM